MNKELQNIVKDIYLIFGKYSANSNMIGSSNYDDVDNWNKQLFKKPLAQLTEDDLSRFTGKAITTWGTNNDYKHFLPRILELTAQFNTPYEIWIVFDKLELSEWKKWEENERLIIEKYMISLWENLIEDDSFNANFEFKDYFSSLSNFYPNFNQLLFIWEKSESKSSIKYLTNYIIDENINIFKRGIISGLYNKVDNIKEFRDWLLSEKIIEKLQRKYFEFETESFSERISWVEQILISERSLIKK